MSVIEGLVSTIIPVYNRPEMLAEAIDSVINQNYRPIEIIIVNDGSTDHTLQVANSYADDNDYITVISIENSGVGVARETGRLQAKGEFIQYLDSDDILMKTKFSSQIRALREAEYAGTCYGKTDLYLEVDATTIKASKRTGENISGILPSMLSNRWWSTSSAIYRRSVCDSAGGWQNLINEEDWEYDCRIALSNNNLCFVDETVTLIRRHSGPQLSNNGATDLNKLASRATAHQLIVGHALEFGLDSHTAEFEHLLVASFLLSRQCGAKGLVEQSKQLLIMARRHLISNFPQQVKMAVYHCGCRLIGWQTMGKIALYRDKIL